MKTKKNGVRIRTQPSVELISKALNEAAQDALEIHRQVGKPLAIWQDGKPVLVPAELVTTPKNRMKRRRPKS